MLLLLLVYCFDKFYGVVVFDTSQKRKCLVLSFKDHQFDVVTMSLMMDGASITTEESNIMIRYYLVWAM